MHAQNHTINKEMQRLKQNLKSIWKSGDTMYLSSCESSFVQWSITNVVGQVYICPRLQG